MQTHEFKLLIIDDEPNIRSGLLKGLQPLCLQIHSAGNAEEGINLFRAHRHDMVITDMRLPGTLDGLDILRAIREEKPETQVIVITAYATIETAVDAMRLGAFDFITKPLDLGMIRHQVNKAVEHLRLLNENRQLRDELTSLGKVPDLIGNGAATRDLVRQIVQVAHSDATVLLLGESGTGKELTARAIHHLSDRQASPFVGVNLGALPESLLESELFGHEKGAFTDAHRQKVGHFEAAGAGTLFLDEITETPAKTQISLLRVLEEREFRRVGSETVRPFHARVVSASNQDMERLVEDGGFREDLYYRLNVVPIHLPPLRERRDDIPLLVNHFMESFSRRHRQEPKQLAPQVMLNLIDRPWPGNIRQLKNYVERLVVTIDRPLVRLEDLPKEVNHSRATGAVRRLNEAVEEAERQALGQALIHAGYHRERAADLLGISVRSLHYKMSRYGLH